MDLVAGGPIGLDRAGEILAEAAVEEEIVVADLKTRLGEEIGKILLEILVDVLKTGPRFARCGRFAVLHLSLVTSDS